MAAWSPAMAGQGRWDDDARVLIYALEDPRDGAVGYVGATTRPAFRLQQHLADGRRVPLAGPKERWIAALLAAGVEPRMRLLEQTSAVAAPARENHWAHAFGKATLVSGRGRSGRRPPLSTSAAQLGRAIRSLRRCSQSQLAEAVNAQPPYRAATQMPAVLRSLREASGLDESALAVAAGLDVSRYQQLERGTRELTFTVLCAVADRLGIPASELVVRAEAAAQQHSLCAVTDAGIPTTARRRPARLEATIVCAFERGSRDIGVGQLGRIAAVLAVSPAELAACAQPGHPSPLRESRPARHQHATVPPSNR